jgi:hypothetical protein
MASFYKSRAEDLVTTQEMTLAGEPPSPLRPGESLDPMKEVVFPKLDKLNHFIPTSKISNTHGPAQISSHIVSTFWDEIKS